MFDVCVIGHVTRDIVAIKGRPVKSMPGGTAYYSAIAFGSLGPATAVVPRVAPGRGAAFLRRARGAGGRGGGAARQGGGASALDRAGLKSEKLFR